ncbi:MAG: hypothetical protein P8Y71_25310 [Pseudolabrys sp.]
MFFELVSISTDEANPRRKSNSCAPAAAQRYMNMRPLYQPQNNQAGAVA